MHAATATLLDATAQVARDADAVVLRARGVTKRYGRTVALDAGEFELRRGEVHALLGSNGCGKSTLCKIMSGAIANDAGEVLLDGRAATFKDPLDARRAGIGTVYQELSLAPTLSVAANILMGREPMRGFGWVDERALRQRARDIAHANHGLAGHLDVDALVADLSIDQQQIVEILKALSSNPRVVFFDEATSSLDKAQVQSFFERVRELKADGVASVFISHRMDEIFAIADRVTVMRNGRWVATREVGATDRAELLGLMVGQTPSTAAPPRARVANATPLLVVKGLNGPKLHDVDLALHQGEILGLGGLHGQGQSDLLLSLFGAIAAHADEIAIGGRTARITSPAVALRQGLAYVSGDRGRAGALAGRPILENLALSQWSRRRAPWASRRALAAQAEPMIERLQIKLGALGDVIGTLSGGNQQKVILGRALAVRPRVLLLDDPTKGIDVQAKRDLYVLLKELCAQGMAVLLYSSEDDELLKNADRVLVFNGGRIADELRGDRLNEYHLYAAALDGSH